MPSKVAVTGVQAPKTNLELTLEKTSSSYVYAAQERGSALCQKAEKIYANTQKLIPALAPVRNAPARFFCSLFTMAWGFFSVARGNVTMGAVASVAGTRELLNLYRTVNRSDLVKSLNAIQADAGIISALMEANRESTQLMQANLAEIGRGIKGLHDQLSDIRAISVQGDTEVAAKKQEALDLNKRAVDAYNNAWKLMAVAQVNLAQSSSSFEACGVSFKQIVDLANNENPNQSLQERVDQIVAVARNAQEISVRGKGFLDETSHKFGLAMEMMSEANALRDRASQAFGQAVQIAQDTSRLVQERAEITDECEAQVQTVQQELQKVERRNGEILEVISDLRQAADRAQLEARNRPTSMGLAIGVSVSAMTSSIPLGLAASWAYDNAPMLYESAMKTYQWITGIQPIEPPPMPADKLINVVFSEKSSGWWGYMMGRRSSTCGILEINLGDEVFRAAFDLNDSEKLDALVKVQLFEKMNTNLAQGKMTGDHCLKVLDQLEKVVISRGERGVSRGLITPEQPSYKVFKLLKEISMEKYLAAINPAA